MTQAYNKKDLRDQTRLWMALNPKATSKEAQAAMRRIRAELSGGCH